LRPIPPRALVILLAGLAATIAWAQGEDAVSLPPVVVTAPHPVEPPRYREITRPPYPEAARRQGLEGTVVLLIKVLTDGHTGEIKVKRSSGHAALDEAAVEAARRWAFHPATQGRAPVEAWVEVPVTFELAVPK
jgi:protein TonB